MLLASVPGPVSAIASDGRYVVVGVVGGVTRVLERATGRVAHALRGPWTKSALIVDDVAYLVAGATGEVRAFGLADGGPRIGPPVIGADGVRRWAGGLVTGGDDGLVSFGPDAVRVAEYGLRRRLNAFDVDDELVIAAYDAGAGAGPVRAFEARTGARAKGRVDGHASAVLAVALVDDALYTSARDGTVRAYDRGLAFQGAVGLPAGDAACALVVDPVDRTTLHALGAGAAYRLDRATLVIRDATPACSAYAAFSVDRLGRLVGVDGGVVALDEVAPAEAPAPSIACSYEEDGYFDKDEQGWCARKIDISQEGRRVSIHRWYDANGIIRSDETMAGTIERVDADTASILVDDGRWLRFDLRARVLR
jgi:hypothetical protein